MVLESHGISYENRKIDNMGLPADYSSNANVICVTPSHQFPTGTIMPIGRRQELLRWANETGGYILEDDYDSEFKYQGRPIPPMKSMDVGDRIIYFGSFSKCLSPALRTSYMVLPKELTSRFDALKHLPGPTVPTLTQLTLATFISKGHFQRHLNRMRNLYRKRREAMVNTLNQWDFPHFISGAEAGIHLLLHLPGFKKRKELLNNISKHKINITVSDYRSETAKSEESTLLLGFGSMNIEDIQNGLQLLLKTIESISQEE
ncbi:MAG: PLP-dependent aminotransferase family protein [Tissierellia bacterium]|nr:PLP-dependent aminotransferase family protein [Tissierellia bacterium]